MEHSEPDPAVSGVVVTTSQVSRLAVAASLARFKGQSRIHTESDLRGFLVWCELRGLNLLAARRPHVELYVRWLQEVRRFRTEDAAARARHQRTHLSGGGILMVTTHGSGGTEG